VSWTRVHEHWHNPSDVVAGFLLGTLSALSVYRLFYPSLFSKQAGIPKSIWSMAASQSQVDGDDDGDDDNDVKGTIQKLSKEETLPINHNDDNNV
jgi:hypothetical protein